MNEFTSKPFNPLNDLSLIICTAEDQTISEEILLDWFGFLGGKPSEVILVDNGSSLPTQQQYWQLFLEKRVDKLQLSQPITADKSPQPRHVQLYTAGAVACKSYLLWINANVRPQQQGYEMWLDDATRYLTEGQALAITGGQASLDKQQEAGTGWFYSNQFNFDFLLIQRNTFVAAVDEYAGHYVTSGFTTENPATAEGRSEEMIEIALQRYMEQHRLYPLMRQEDATWRIGNINVPPAVAATLQSKLPTPS